ncbi:hypothetical protein LMG26840_03241 [Achromobacter dolens]|nr:hypothetical protein LMG26840_03241 [Achromobacter dolens]
MRLQVIIMIDSVALSSSAKSREATLSSALASGPLKPSMALVLSRSIGNEVPASAQAPSGEASAVSSTCASRPISRDHASTNADR